VTPSKSRRQHIAAEFAARFAAEPSVWVRAPGRVDLMGSHTDYNMGHVLTMAIDRDTWIAARPRADNAVRIRSLTIDGESVFALDDITHDTQRPWADYVRGVAAVLQAEGCALTGFDGLVHSTIPIGSGLSSSAALECATAVLFQTLGGWQMDSVEMARLCQRAENEFVGMNCGLLDQYSSMMGKTGSAICLDCRSLTNTPVAVPNSMQVVICDTRARRQLTGTEYSERRAQCEEGARLLGQFYPGVTALRDVSLEQFERHEHDLPEIVARRCRFIIEEDARVLQLAEALPVADLDTIRDLSVSSFAGACALYEICSAEMTAMMDALLGAPGVIGARQAGAGFGGCMVAFVDAAQVEAFREAVATGYLRDTGIRPEIYAARPAPGAGMVEDSLER